MTANIIVILKKEGCPARYYETTLDQTNEEIIKISKSVETWLINKLSITNQNNGTRLESGKESDIQENGQAQASNESDQETHDRQGDEKA